MRAHEFSDVITETIHISAPYLFKESLMIVRGIGWTLYILRIIKFLKFYNDDKNKKINTIVRTNIF